MAWRATKPARLMPPTPTSGGARNKLPGLELIRFLCALAVLVWHYQHFTNVCTRPIGLVVSHQPFHTLLRPFYEYGFYGVQVFWCISGFIFFWKYRDAIADGRIGGGRFFMLRVSRLYPLHLATLLTVALLQSVYFSYTGCHFVYAHNDEYHFLLQLFLASDWGLQTGESFNGPIWSISMEVLVYLIFFLTLRYLGRSWVPSLIVVTVYVLAWHYLGWVTRLGGCLAFFHAGGLAAMAYRRMDNADIARRVADATAMIAVVIVPVAVFAAGAIHGSKLLVFFLLGYVPLLLFVTARPVTLPRRLQAAIEDAGNLTYSSYLIHFPLQLVVAIFYTARGERIPYEAWPLFAGYMLVTLVLARVVYRGFELPAQNLIRDRFDRVRLSVRGA